MKKAAATLGVLALVGLLAVPVLAHRGGWGSSGCGPGYGPGYCWQEGAQASGLTQEQRAQLENLEQKFYEETSALRTEIWTKADELDRLLGASELDAKKIKALQKEISDVQAKMAEKRLDFQLEVRKIAPDAARTYARGFGRHMRGYGPGPCWDN